MTYGAMEKTIYGCLGGGLGIAVPVRIAPQRYALVNVTARNGSSQLYEKVKTMGI